MVYCLERCWKIRVDNSEVKTIAMLRFFSRRIMDFLVQQSNFYWELKIDYYITWLISGDWTWIAYF